MKKDIQWVLNKLDWMREQGIWPNGLRYLWTDAFGVVLLVSLYHHLGEDRYLDEARHVVAEVDRVLGRERGVRIGEAPDRDGQYYHYLGMWMFALGRLGEVIPEYHDRAVELVRQVHPAFVDPGRGVWWKMEENLSGPYPGYGRGGLDPFHGYVVYRYLDPEGLASEIGEMEDLVRQLYPGLNIDQDLGLGMMLWMCHFHPEEEWAKTQRGRCLQTLNRLWIDPPGYFCRQTGANHVRFAFTNYGISVGLQAVGEQTDRVARLNTCFDTYRSGDHYDVEAITHVMGCSSHFPGKMILG
ncbi:MAG: hypothetical protein ACLFOY_17850 [Desulfatibacillaceae bacterium]